MFFAYLLVFFIGLTSAEYLRHQRAAIGVLSSDEKVAGESVIKITYATFLKSADAIVIPIPWDIEDDKFYTLLRSVNGIMFTGGNALLWDDHDTTTQVRTNSEYQSRMESAYNFALNMNKEGIHYPVYGICQGMEVLGIAITHDPYLLDNYTHFGKLDNIQFTAEGRTSKMFSHFDKDIFQYLQQKKAMYYWHQYSLNTSVPMLYPSFNEWKVTALGYDDNGKEFLAGVEHNQYPIFMHMFHPERIYHEYVHENNSKKHEIAAADSARRMAEMFIQEALKNKNSFEKGEIVSLLAIENFKRETFGTSGTFYVVNKYSLDQIWDIHLKKSVSYKDLFLYFTLIQLIVVYFCLKRSGKYFKKLLTLESASIFGKYVEINERKFY